jgi:hypothetical protein
MRGVGQKTPGCGGEGRGLFRHQRAHRGGVNLCHAEPLLQGGQRVGRGITESVQRSQQCGQEHVDPLIGFALAHAEQAPLDYLERIGLQVGQDKQEPVFRCRQGAVLIDSEPASGSRFPIEAPRGHMGLERRLKQRKQELKLVEHQAG